MALRINRPRPLLQDENAENNLVSGKVPGATGLSAGNKALGLKPQQQPLLERKKLSNITNQLQQKSAKGKVAVENVGAKAASQSFSVKVDTEFAQTKAGLQDVSIKIPLTPRVPLKDITNDGNPPQEQTCAAILNQVPEQSQANIPNLRKQKVTVESLSQPDVKFNFPPSSKFNLTEEMKAKAALWSKEGIERVHFSGKDMEELREKMEQEEIDKRVAAVLSCRIDIPFPRLRPPKDFSWKFPDQLEMDLLKDLNEDADSNYEGLDDWRPDTDIEATLLGYTDYLAHCSPPRFSEGWPEIRAAASEYF